MRTEQTFPTLMAKVVGFNRIIHVHVYHSNWQFQLRRPHLLPSGLFVLKSFQLSYML